MPDLPDDVKKQAALAALGAKTSLRVDALPVADATMADVERGPTTTPGMILAPGSNYNPVEPVAQTPEPPPPPEPKPQQDAQEK
jgi:hypothetical protein